ncbi:MAG: hypothetical protein J7641_14400 [Cyanobacteria bacterium SID2]|nr:hypothetical protein [Cyanobacteria bacterium SID2]MBP0005106.1 hypothetical protein [Cyanobacteria bacterium SBC]
MLFTGGVYFYERNRKVKTAHKMARMEADRAVQEIDRALQNLEDVVDKFADELNRGELPKTQLEAKLQQALETNENLASAGVAYAPYGYNAQKQRYAPVFKRVLNPQQPNQSSIERYQVENFYDYTQSDVEWFQKPLNGGAQWAEPYIGQVLQQLLAEYSVPFTTPDTKPPVPTPNGIVYANYDFERLQKLMNSLDLGNTGYGFLISKTGKFVYHPISSFALEEASIFDLARRWNAPDLEELGNRMTDGQSGTLERGGRTPSWVIYEPIPSTQWSLGVVVFKDEVFASTNRLNRTLIWFVLLIVATLVFASIAVFRPTGDRIGRLWGLVTTISVFLAGGIGAIWVLDMRNTGGDENPGTKLSNPARLERFLANRTQKAIDSGQTPPVFVPTGVFVQSLEFSDANDVFATGYVWQRYQDGVHDGIARGFVLPEAIAPKIEEYYRQSFDGSELIGWYFEAKLRQPFDYSKFPFDRKDVWIRLWHQDFTSNVMLVPELSAYDVISPVNLPGLESGKNFVLPGWHLERSFFQYRLNSYNTTFGFLGETQLKNFPELYFDIVMRRDFLTVFITKMMRTVVVSVLLFGVQSIVRFKLKDDELGFSASGVISASGAFTFILILDQINLRSQLATGGVLYIEYFYFVLYVMILLVAIDSLLVGKRSNLFFIRYRNNLFPKLFYWPVLLTLQLLVTAYVFY